jgi:hypothetical protein
MKFMLPLDQITEQVTFTLELLTPLFSIRTRLDPQLVLETPLVGDLVCNKALLTCHIKLFFVYILN